MKLRKVTNTCLPIVSSVHLSSYKCRIQKLRNKLCKHKNTDHAHRLLVKTHKVLKYNLTETSLISSLDSYIVLWVPVIFTATDYYVLGVYDVTSLAMMPWFDIVLGLVPGYMHGCLLGVTKTLLYNDSQQLITRSHTLLEDRYYLTN